MSTVTVLFPKNRDYQLQVPEAELTRYSREEALRWLDKEWKDLGCVPTNPVGKVLLLDKVFGIARDAGEKRFKVDSAWAASYARAVAAALGRANISVNVVEGVVA
jgi:hypothetical protein